MDIVPVLKVRVPPTAPIAPVVRVLLLLASRLTVTVSGIMNDVVPRRAGWME